MVLSASFQCLYQSSFSFLFSSTEPLERFCPFFKTTEMLSTILTLHELAIHAVKETASPDHHHPHTGITWDCIDKAMEETIEKVERLRFEVGSCLLVFHTLCFISFIFRITTISSSSRPGASVFARASSRSSKS